MRAKGHEYDGVIVLECNDGEWTSHMSYDLEEERRLMEVARKYLYFLTDSALEDSRFFSEMNLD